MTALDAALGAAPDRVAGGARGRVLLCSSNGGGLGHLTRLLAIARRLPAGVDAVFVTMSHGLPLVTREGHVAEFVPSSAHLDAHPGTWHAYLRRRMDALLDHYRPDVLVYDGVTLYRGLLDSWAGYAAAARVWSRRALWRPGVAAPGDGGGVIDTILEPGDVAAAIDHGATVRPSQRARLCRVPPIVHLDERELLPRPAARAALGLDPDRPATLLTLGAGNINDIGVTARRVVAALRAAGGDVQVMMLRSPIAGPAAQGVAPDGVAVASVYPVSRYLRAFDVAFSAAGYNSFHELLAFAVPTVFVPNEHAIVDDQGARARFAEWAGAALAVSEWSTDELVGRVRAVLDPHVQAHLSARCRAVFPGNGAAAAAALLAGRVPAAPVGAGIGM